MTQNELRQAFDSSNEAGENKFLVVVNHHIGHTESIRCSSYLEALYRMQNSLENGSVLLFLNNSLVLRIDYYSCEQYPVPQLISPYELTRVIEGKVPSINPEPSLLSLGMDADETDEVG